IHLKEDSIMVIGHGNKSLGENYILINILKDSNVLYNDTLDYGVFSAMYTSNMFFNPNLSIFDKGNLEIGFTYHDTVNNHFQRRCAIFNTKPFNLAEGMSIDTFQSNFHQYSLINGKRYGLINWVRDYLPG